MNIHSIQIGQPQTIHTPDPESKSESKAMQSSEKGWFSGIFKSTVEGPRFLGATNLVGDGQADLKNHGGADKAVCAYALEHYDYWRKQLNLPQMPVGAFGENFTTNGLDESTFCIGDTLSVGEAQEVIIQISQPRAPCWKLARRWQIKDLALQVESTGYTGWYFRVLHEGVVQPGDTLRLIERPYPQWTLAEANRLMHHDTEDWEPITALMECPALAISWRNSFRRRINFHGPNRQSPTPSPSAA